MSNNTTNKISSIIILFQFITVKFLKKVIHDIPTDCELLVQSYLYGEPLSLSEKLYKQIEEDINLEINPTSPDINYSFKNYILIYLCTCKICDQHNKERIKLCIQYLMKFLNMYKHYQHDALYCYIISKELIKAIITCEPLREVMILNRDLWSDNIN